MVTEDPAMAPGTLAGGCIEDYERDLEVLLREQNQHGGLDTERDLNICRSGSAPPLGGHQGFYYSKEDLKSPRMQHTMLWPSSQGVQVSARSVGKIGDGRRKKELSAGTADMRQEGLGKPTCVSGLPSRPKSTPLHNDMETLDNMYSGAMSHSFSPALGSSMARSTGPEPQLIRTLTSPCLHALGGRFSDTDQNIISNGFGGVSSGKADYDDVANTLFGLNLSDNHLEELHQRQYLHQNNSSSTIPSRVYDDFSKASFSNGRINLPKRSMVAFDSTRSTRPSGYCQTERTDIDFSGCDSDAYSANQGLPLMSNNQLDAGEGQYFNRIGSQVGSGFQVPITDSLYAQYLRRASDLARPSGPTLRMNRVGTSLMDLPGYEEAYVRAMLAHQKPHYDSSFSGKSGGLNSDLYVNPAFALDMSYSNHLSGSIISSLSPGSHLRTNDRVSLFPSILRSTTGGSKGSWNHENGITKGSFASSLLEELKNNKTRLLELSEIVGHVVEFSVDQYGSRFIQQKLETASVEEKNSIFPEILPHVRVLMTDVFGNYVIQKFFDYGTEVQRDQLAASLIGYILPLSLQMYGCRVIQKALEVVDVDQQTQMVAELVGSVMKCVRDQNGNHVIQKCIECVPQERIQFIVTCFYGQVVALSTHPYGCRVIQRVLEHCDNTQTQSRMMNEILQSVCTLAQDQYGNYVIQHILQHGKPEERSSIVSKLAGQIVKMSQQKFASNVVEKCLTFCTPNERELLIDEILGSSTDENEAFQAMMKDQFGNYVVQRVLESCDDQKLELIISRIRVHLSVLKKYTYGKHIVARVEKLVATGERRIVMSLANLA